MTQKNGAIERLGPLELDLEPLSRGPASTGSVTTALDRGWHPSQNLERATGKYDLPPTFANPLGNYEDILIGDRDRTGVDDVHAAQAISVTRYQLFILFAQTRLTRLRNGSMKGAVESLMILSYVLFHLGIPYSDIEPDFTQEEFLDLRAQINAQLIQQVLHVSPSQIKLSHLALIYGAIADEPDRSQPEVPWIIQADRNAHVAFANDLVQRLRTGRGSRGVLLLLQEAIRRCDIDIEHDLNFSQTEYARYRLAYGCVEP